MGNKVPDPPTVLSVVDDMFFSARIESTARLAGVRLIQICDARHLEKALEESVPRMIILDLNSKACEPLDLVRRIKSDTRFSRVGIVGFLSHIQRELELNARQAGCDQVMPKSAFSANLGKILGSLRAKNSHESREFPD